MKKAFLMIGQSNMAGRGRIDEVEPIRDPRMLTVRNLRTLPLWEPLNPDRVMAGVCLGTSFAKSFIDECEDECVMIPCADGGTRLNEWQKGKDLYENAVFITKNVMKYASLSGILWHQGESDCHSELVSTYYERFMTMITDLKRDLGAEDVPVFVGGLGEYLRENPEPRFRNMPMMNTILRSIGENDNFYYVSPRGLGCNSDFLHFNAVALREFGRRYYTAYKERRNVEDSEFEGNYTVNEGESALLEATKRLLEERNRGLITEEQMQKQIAELISNA